MINMDKLVDDLKMGSEAAALGVLDQGKGALVMARSADVMTQLIRVQQENQIMLRLLYDAVHMIEDENIGQAALRVWARDAQLLLKQHREAIAEKAMTMDRGHGVGMNSGDGA